MNRARIEDLLEKALDLVTDPTNTMYRNGEIASKYFGYVDSFGPSVIQAGLLKTVFFFCQEKESADRKPIMNLLKKLYSQNIREEIPEGTDFHAYLAGAYQPRHDATRAAIIRNRVLEAAVALKLAMKTIKKSPNPGEDDAD